MELKLTQPAITQRLQRLEDFYGVRLIERTTRSVSLTTHGHAILPIAKRMVSNFERSRREIEEALDAKKRQVAIAVLLSVASTIMPRVIMKVADSDPDIEVMVQDTADPNIGTLVKSGLADYGIQTSCPLSTSGLVATRLFHDRYAFVCRMDHPLAKRRSVCWSLLGAVAEGTSFLARPYKIQTRERLEELIPGVTWRFDVTHRTTLYGMVEAGLGVAIVPELAMKEIGGEKFACVPIVDPVLNREIVLVERQDDGLSKEARVVKEALLSVFEDLNLERHAATGVN